MAEEGEKKPVRPDPKNARRHTDQNKQMIRQSLEEVGAFRGIGIDGEDIIRAGNGVFEQAQALGMKVRVVEAEPDELIAVKRPDLKGEKAVRAALLDNRTSETSEWDAAVLAEMDLEGLFSEDEQDEIRELALLEGEIDAELDAEPRESKGLYNRGSQQIRPVLYVEQVAVLERALRQTGHANRDEALMEVCRAYLGEEDPLL